MGKKETNNKTRLIILLLVIIVIVALFIYLVDISLVARQLSTADPRYIVAASAALILGLITYAIRWRALLGNKPGRLFTFHASNLGHAANIIIPFRAGEVIRILVMGTSESISYTESTTSVVVERLFEQLMRLLTFALALLFGLGIQMSVGSVAGGVGFLILGFGGIAWLVNHQEFTLDKGFKTIGKTASGNRRKSTPFPRRFIRQSKGRIQTPPICDHSFLVLDHLGTLLGFLLFNC